MLFEVTEIVSSPIEWKAGKDRGRAASLGYTRSPKQDSRLEYFRQGLGCSEIVVFIGSG